MNALGPGCAHEFFNLFLAAPKMASSVFSVEPEALEISKAIKNQASYFPFAANSLLSTLVMTLVIMVVIMHFS